MSFANGCWPGNSPANLSGNPTPPGVMRCGRDGGRQGWYIRLWNEDVRRKALGFGFHLEGWGPSNLSQRLVNSLRAGPGPPRLFVCAHAHLSIKRQTLSFFACGKNKTLWGKLDESPILNGIFDSYKNFLSIFYVNRLTFLKADGILVSIRKGRKFESKGRPKHA